MSLGAFLVASLYRLTSHQRVPLPIIKGNLRKSKTGNSSILLKIPEHIRLTAKQQRHGRVQIIKLAYRQPVYFLPGAFIRGRADTEPSFHTLSSDVFKSDDIIGFLITPALEPYHGPLCSPHPVFFSFVSVAFSASSQLVVTLINASRTLLGLLRAITAPGAVRTSTASQNSHDGGKDILNHCNPEALHF